MNTGKKFAYGLLALVVVAAVKTCNDTNSGSSASALSDADRANIEAQAHADSTGSTPTTAPTAASLTAKIKGYAFEDYTPDQYPKLFKALGKAGVKEAEAGSKAAALKAALSEDCKSVENASVTMQSTKKHMEFFVNCEIDPVEGSPLEMKQWRFQASELKDAHGKWLTAETATGTEAPGESDTDKNLKAQEAERNQAPADYMRCEEAIKAQLDYPSSADFHYLAGRADFVNPNNENVIKIEFDAKNGYGNMLPFVANCIFKHNGKVIADIYKR